MPETSSDSDAVLKDMQLYAKTMDKRTIPGFAGYRVSPIPELSYAHILNYENNRMQQRQLTSVSTPLVELATLKLLVVLERLAVLLRPISAINQSINLYFRHMARKKVEKTDRKYLQQMYEYKTKP